MQVQQPPARRVIVDQRHKMSNNLIPVTKQLQRTVMPDRRQPPASLLKDRHQCPARRRLKWQSPGTVETSDLVMLPVPRVLAGAGMACPRLLLPGSAEVSGVRAGPQGRRVSDAQQP